MFTNFINGEHSQISIANIYVHKIAMYGIKICMYAVIDRWQLNKWHCKLIVSMISESMYIVLLLFVIEVF